MALPTRATTALLLILTILYLAAAAFLPFSQYLLQHGSLHGTASPRDAYPYPIVSSLLQVAAATIVLWLSISVTFCWSPKRSESLHHFSSSASPPPFTIQSETDLPPTPALHTILTNPTPAHPLLTVITLLIPPSLLFALVIILSNIAIGGYSFILHLLAHPASIAITAIATSALWGIGSGKQGEGVGGPLAVLAVVAVTVGVAFAAVPSDGEAHGRSHGSWAAGVAINLGMSAASGLMGPTLRWSLLRIRTRYPEHGQLPLLVAIKLTMATVTLAVVATVSGKAGAWTALRHASPGVARSLAVGVGMTALYQSMVVVMNTYGTAMYFGVLSQSKTIPQVLVATYLQHHDYDWTAWHIVGTTAIGVGTVLYTYASLRQRREASAATSPGNTRRPSYIGEDSQLLANVFSV